MGVPTSAPRARQPSLHGGSYQRSPIKRHRSTKAEVEARREKLLDIIEDGHPMTVRKRIRSERNRKTLKSHVGQINELIEDAGYRIVSSGKNPTSPYRSTKLGAGMSKAALRCVGFKPVCRGSLRGFASIEFPDLKMVVHGIGIHVAANGTWASPPAQAIIKNGAAVKDDAGKVGYSPPLLEFGSADVRRAWSHRVVQDVLVFAPTALRCREEAA